MTLEEEQIVRWAELFRNVLRGNGGHIEGAVTSACRVAATEERERIIKLVGGLA